MNSLQTLQLYASRPGDTRTLHAVDDRRLVLLHITRGKNPHRKLAGEVRDHNLHGEGIIEGMDVLQRNLLRLRVTHTKKNDVVHHHHDVVVGLRNQKEQVICYNIRRHRSQLVGLRQGILINFLRPT